MVRDSILVVWDPPHGYPASSKQPMDWLETNIAISESSTCGTWFLESCGDNCVTLAKSDKTSRGGELSVQRKPARLKEENEPKPNSCLGLLKASSLSTCSAEGWTTGRRRWAPGEGEWHGNSLQVRARQGNRGPSIIRGSFASPTDTQNFWALLDGGVTDTSIPGKCGKCWKCGGGWE